MGRNTVTRADRKKEGRVVKGRQGRDVGYMETGKGVQPRRKHASASDGTYDRPTEKQEEKFVYNFVARSRFLLRWFFRSNNNAKKCILECVRLTSSGFVRVASHGQESQVADIT